ncbi:MAG: SDR family NAD(P)-dependent oxidoreductase [Planctomycetota bacterium]|jgi:NAD(P)-dependent dehydrogenase (short-subunit alcohol dehydrogenase family)
MLGDRIKSGESTDCGRVWITGASSGLGRALARRMAADGWSVAASARGADQLDHLAESAAGLRGHIRAFPLDVTDGDAVKTTVARIEHELGPIDQAVLNAGSHQSVRAAGLTAVPFRQLVELNLMGTIHCLEALLGTMIPRRAGRIAVVASLAGYRGLPTSAAYGMTKAGLINMAEALKPELDLHGVGLQLVNPGFVRTPLTDKNPFPMPFLMDVEEAAEALYRGLQSDRFEIVFPRRFAYLLKLLRIMPAPLAFAITRRMVPREA